MQEAIKQLTEKVTILQTPKKHTDDVTGNTNPWQRVSRKRSKNGLYTADNSKQSNQDVSKSNNASNSAVNLAKLTNGFDDVRNVRRYETIDDNRKSDFLISCTSTKTKVKSKLNTSKSKTKITRSSSVPPIESFNRPLKGNNFNERLADRIHIMQLCNYCKLTTRLCKCSNQNIFYTHLNKSRKHFKIMHLKSQRLHIKSTFTENVTSNFSPIKLVNMYPENNQNLKQKVNLNIEVKDGVKSININNDVLTTKNNLPIFTINKLTNKKINIGTQTTNNILINDCIITSHLDTMQNSEAEAQNIKIENVDLDDENQSTNVRNKNFKYHFSIQNDNKVRCKVEKCKVTYAIINRNLINMRQHYLTKHPSVTVDALNFLCHCNQNVALDNLNKHIEGHKILLDSDISSSK